MNADDALWDEFAAESEEHLDTAERILSAGAPDREAVNTLFRALHSLKGMSDALGAGGMRAIAHRCEDLLGHARAGRLAVEGPVADGLISAIDALRQIRAAVLEARQDRPADPALLDRLARLDAAPPPQAVPAAAPTADPLLGAFASRCAAAAPALAGLSSAADPAALAELTDLASAARLSGLHGLAAAFVTLAEAAGTGAALPALGHLRRRLALLADRAGEPAGAELIPQNARGALNPAPFAAIADSLARGEGDAPVAAIRAAAAAAHALGQDSLERLLLTLEDLADRAGDPDAAALLPTRAPALAEALRVGASGSATPIGEGAAADVRIPAAFATLLSPTARQRALDALDAGGRLYIARLALSRGDGQEEAIAAALRPEADILGSRALPKASPPLVELLLASSADLDTLSRAATAADPARRVLLSLSPVEEESAAGPATSGPTMRVRQDRIDRIIALEAEVRAASLTLAESLREAAPRAAIARLSVLANSVPGSAGRELVTLADRLRRFEDALEDSENRLALSLRRLDEAVMELRVVPVGTLFARLPRVARAVAAASGKQVEVVLEGEDVAIDRSLVELLADPLLHLTRNAVDHGIESPAARHAAGKPERATLRISAARRTGGIRVRVSDDGGGILRERVLARAIERGFVTPAEADGLTDAAVHALLFRPGFSTASMVTETSGRGVGLDVVQDAARRAGGTLEIATTPGQGTSFTLRLPLTAATQPVLLIEVSGHPYALPVTRVEEVLDGADDRPSTPLALLLGLPAAAPGAVVVARTGSGPLALGVDRVLRRAELLLRPLHPAIARLPGVGGVGVLGGGEPVLLLEPDGLAEESAAQPLAVR
ncbi:ATP-binding protein [Muricoccus radiodurans]|uniref:ATP-binding protein n=1 Tax=Muricoccus radiodurans TaxID=2231721 RepID=UPI003CF67936